MTQLRKVRIHENSKAKMVPLTMNSLMEQDDNVEAMREKLKARGKKKGAVGDNTTKSVNALLDKAGGPEGGGRTTLRNYEPKNTKSKYSWGR